MKDLTSNQSWLKNGKTFWKKDVANINENIAILLKKTKQNIFSDCIPSLFSEENTTNLVHIQGTKDYIDVVSDPEKNNKRT